jgi:hypothetical protein
MLEGTKNKRWGGSQCQKMDFDQLLMACPTTFTAINIECMNLTMNTLPSDITSIKHLTLKNVGLASALAKSFETCFQSYQHYIFMVL